MQTAIMIMINMPSMHSWAALVLQGMRCVSCVCSCCCSERRFPPDAAPDACFQTPSRDDHPFLRNWRWTPFLSLSQRAHVCLTLLSESLQPSTRNPFSLSREAREPRMQGKVLMFALRSQEVLGSLLLLLSLCDCCFAVSSHDAE